MEPSAKLPPVPQSPVSYSAAAQCFESASSDEDALNSIGLLMQDMVESIAPLNNDDGHSLAIWCSLLSEELIVSHCEPAQLAQCGGHAAVAQSLNSSLRQAVLEMLDGNVSCWRNHAQSNEFLAKEMLSGLNCVVLKLSCCCCFLLVTFKQLRASMRRLLSYSETSNAAPLTRSAFSAMMEPKRLLPGCTICAFPPFLHSFSKQFVALCPWLTYSVVGSLRNVQVPILQQEKTRANLSAPPRFLFHFLSLLMRANMYASSASLSRAAASKTRILQRG